MKRRNLKLIKVYNDINVDLSDDKNRDNPNKHLKKKSAVVDEEYSKLRGNSNNKNKYEINKKV